jgi:hypothetical protein
MERLIDPVIADLQHEHDSASAPGQSRERRWILLRGYLAFWTVVALHVPIVWTRRIVRELAVSDDRAVGRAVICAIATMLALTAIFVAAPLQNVVRRDVNILRSLPLLLPQSLPLSLPFSILVGVLAGLRGQTVTGRARRAVLTVGLAGSLASFGTIIWVMPATNHAFRATIAGRDVPKGPNEISVRALRGQALAIKHDGLVDWAGMLLFSYHSRWALVGAALVFAVFGLGVTALRAGPAATAGIGTVGCIVYLTYFFELGMVRPSVFSDERVACGLAWLPNILMILTSLAFLSARDDTRLADHI